MYKKIDSSKSFVEMEKDTLKLWNEKDIVKKNFELNKDGEYFTFLTDPRLQMENLM